MCEDDHNNNNSSRIEDSLEVKVVNSPEIVRKRMRFVVPESAPMDLGAREELQELMQAMEGGMAFIMDHSYVKAKRGSSWIKKIVINYGYDFLRRNSRGPTYALSVPHASIMFEFWFYYYS
ncbi:hypothetical protein ACSQ67_025897 [Phaseolus vulgaris]